MGNRAVIQFEKIEESTDKLEVYIHWNGGPESVLAFLQTLVERKWTRADYLPARLCGVISEFFDNSADDPGLSLAVAPKGTHATDFLDNPLYTLRHLDSEGFRLYQGIKQVCYEKLTPALAKKYLGIMDQMREIRANRLPPLKIKKISQ